MAQRIALTVLGGTAAPYSSSNPAPPFGVSTAVSEIESFDVSQLQLGKDTTAAQRALYPAALSSVVVKYVKANHFESRTIYVHIDAAAVNALANA